MVIRNVRTKTQIKCCYQPTAHIYWLFNTFEACRICWMPHYKTSCSLTHKLTIKRSVLMKPAQTLLHIAKTTIADTRFHQCRLQRHKRCEIVVKWHSNRPYITEHWSTHSWIGKFVWLVLYGENVQWIRSVDRYICITSSLPPTNTFKLSSRFKGWLGNGSVIRHATILNGTMVTIRCMQHKGYLKR